MLFCDPFCTPSSKLLQPGRHSRPILGLYRCCRKQLYYFQAWMFSPRVQRFKDLFWSQRGRWPACPSDTRHVSHTCQTSSGNYLPSGACISGNVHYWCSHVWRLLTGRNRNGIWHISRQTIPSSERSGHDGRKCSRNYGDIFLRGCLLMLISEQCLGLY